MQDAAVSEERLPLVNDLLKGGLPDFRQPLVQSIGIQGDATLLITAPSMPGPQMSSELSRDPCSAVYRDTGLFNQLVQLRARCHKCRRHDHAAQGRTNDHALFKTKGAALPRQIVFVGEAFARSLVLSELQGCDEARALDLADHRVVAEHFAQDPLQVRSGILLHLA